MYVMRYFSGKAMSKSSNVKSIQAYELIRELILRGELLPGVRLVLTDLEERLGVGRGPIREAIMRLDRSGLIQNLPYKGAVVAEVPTFQEIQYIYEMRVHLECILAVESMKIAGKKEYALLESILKKMEESSAENSFFFQPDREFHHAMYAIACMPHLLNMADNLVDHVEIFLNSRYYAPQDQEILIQQHREIFQAFQEKDGVLLEERLKRNILIGLQLIQQEMERIRR